MDLFEEMNENENKKKQKNSKLGVIIIISIAVILIVIFAIIGIMMYLESTKMKFSIDGAPQTISEGYFQVNEDGSIDISIQDMAQLLGTDYFKGELSKNSEDKSKGYISFDEETVTFEANSKKIYKIETSSSEDDYSYMYIDKEIKYTNGKLYTTPEGIQKILNVSCTFTNNTVNIFSLNYLNEYYTEKIANYGYKQISEEYVNQKALKNDILIVEREDGKIGIIKPDGSEIVGPKYTDIQYIENTGDFIVTNGDKVGIINNQGRSKIDLEYDEIKVLDEDLGLYIVKQDEKSGVVNQTGDIVIYVENDEIGIDASLYKNDNIKNPYLLFENCIPVKRNEKWGLYNKNGKLILPIEYDRLGCIVGTSSNRSAGNVIIIEDYEAIVICKDKYYGIINSTGTQLIPCALDSVYSLTSSGVTKYKIEGKRNGSPYSYDLEEYFDAIGVKKAKRNEETKDTDEIQNIGNTNSNTNNTTEETDEVDNETVETNEDENAEE